MNQDIICNEIDNAIKCLTNLKNLIRTDVKIEVQSTEPIAAIVEPVQVQSTEPAVQVADSDFENLKKALYSDKWPNAVNPNLICDSTSDADKKERGIGILELVIEEPIKTGKFLDFGCGEGHCAAAAVEILGCSSSVGYDTKKFNWPTVANTTFTTSYEEITQLGHYNAILMFDVLDHASGETPAELLKKAADVLAPDGCIYMRCHPWMSRHATHLYHKINKAYAHLVFTEDELRQLSDYVPENNIKAAYPVVTYEKIIKESGLKIKTQRNITEKVDNFFKVPKLAERIMLNTGHKSYPEFQMGLQFIDYVLVKE